MVETELSFRGEKERKRKGSWRRAGGRESGTSIRQTNTTNRQVTVGRGGRSFTRALAARAVVARLVSSVVSLSYALLRGSRR